MTNYNDKNGVPDWNNGKIHGWNGGYCPVHPKTELKVWFRNGGIDYWPAKALEWTHQDRPGDIIAFRVVKEHREPKVIWVNEYATGIAIYTSEEGAKKYVGPSVTRIAVKYVEVTE
jgi:hypothetical protein